MHLSTLLVAIAVALAVVHDASAATGPVPCSPTCTFCGALPGVVSNMQIIFTPQNLSITSNIFGNPISCPVEAYSFTIAPGPPGQKNGIGFVNFSNFSNPSDCLGKQFANNLDAPNITFHPEADTHGMYLHVELNFNQEPVGKFNMNGC